MVVHSVLLVYWSVLMNRYVCCALRIHGDSLLILVSIPAAQPIMATSGCKKLTSHG